MSTSASTPEGSGEALSGYQKRLFVFLSVATFFEGYDFFALAQVLPNLRADFALSKAGAGALFGFVNVGTIAAFFLVRLADRWGRKQVLTVTIVGYTVATVLSGLAPNVYVFAAAQFVARLFLIAEWAVSAVYAAEEYPASRRGMVIGVLQAFSSLGAIVCAGVAPLLLASSLGWRSVYFVGVIPLIVLAFARRNLAETRRFAERKEAGETGSSDLFAIWRSPYRVRLIQVGVIWFVTYACSNTAVSFWKEFAVSERGLTDGQVGLALTIAALVSMPMVFAAGKLLDVMGRRVGGVVIMGSSSAGVLLAYGLEGQWALTAGLTIAIFGVGAVFPLLSAFNAELFPTDLRGDAFAWGNNLIGRVSFVLAPVAIGFIAEQSSWGAAVRPTAIFPIIALGLIFWLLPETRARELEDTASL